MCDYSLSEMELKIICAQIEKRAKYRNEFLRARTDPCKNAMEAGYVFDPAHQRFLALKATQFEHFRPNSKTLPFGVFSMLPFLVYGYVVWKQRTQFEEDCRCGRIRYKDRLFKLA